MRVNFFPSLFSPIFGFSHQDVKEERGELSTSGSGSISVSSSTGTVDNFNGVPEILNEDSSPSAGELNVLLPVLIVGELSELVVQVSDITVGIDDVTGLD